MATQVQENIHKKRKLQDENLKGQIKNLYGLDMQNDGVIQAMKAQYNLSQPYRHIAIDKVFDQEFLKQAREQLIQSFDVEYRETDLYKLFQTKFDMKSLDYDSKIQQKAPALKLLREALCSEQFKTLVKEITGVDEIEGDVDMSSNVYMQGHHLLCHDDVISTRKISFILYLTDPDDDWTEKDGGAIELYPVQQISNQENSNDKASIQNQNDTNKQQDQTDILDKILEPQCIPSVRTLPQFNRFFLFSVQPGQSYHSVQEVLSDRRRLSISGWFHGKEAPKGSVNASLKQLQRESQVPQNINETNHNQIDTNQDFTRSELELLSEYINELYLKEESIKAIAAKFDDSCRTILYDFLKPQYSKLLSTLIKLQDENDQVGKGRLAKDNVGINKDWKLVGPPHKRRYLFRPGLDYSLAYKGMLADKDQLILDMTYTIVGEESQTEQELIQQQMQKDFKSNIKLNGVHGPYDNKDQIIKDQNNQNKQSGYEVINGISNKQQENSSINEDEYQSEAIAWESGEVGGFQEYMIYEENQQDNNDDTYQDQNENDNENENQDTITFPAIHNCLTLLLRDDCLLRFEKFLSSQAPNSRWDIIQQYNVIQDEENDNSE